MGTATLWKMLMLAWSYHKGLSIPKKDSKRPFVGGLSRLVKNRVLNKRTKTRF